MGVDITGYRDAEPWDEITNENFEERECEFFDNGGIHVYTIECFRDRLDGAKEGYYKSSGSVEGPSLSYGGYGAWRRALCEAFLFVPIETAWERSDVYDGKPFYELINFADNEGAIGSETSAKLAKDFAEHQEKADALWGEETMGWNIKTYNLFRQACEAAANSGFVVFS